MLFYYIAEANEALIITGAGAHKGKMADVSPTDITEVGAARPADEGTGFKIVVGKGAWVMPVFQKARRLDLGIHQTEISDTCVTSQGIPVGVNGVVTFKVGDDPISIANAARRFLERTQDMDKQVHNIFAGHLRSIVGNMTMEELIGGRSELAEQTRKSSVIEMQKLGLIIDSLQIQELTDPTDYIMQFAAPHQAEVAATARIAQAQRNREATEKEQAAAAEMARATSESEVRQADLIAKSQAAQATAQQAGPRAEAEAQMAVVEQQTRVAELQAAQREQQLQVEIVKPAEAERDAAIARAEAERRRVVLEAQASAEATQVKATAQANATRITGEAEGAAKKAVLLAEAEGIDARGKAVAANKEAVIDQTIAEKLPEIVAASASMFENMENVTVLNGAEGMGDFGRQAIAFGLGVLPTLRESLSGNGKNGHGERSGAANIQ